MSTTTCAARCSTGSTARSCRGSNSGWSGTGLYEGNGSEDELYKVIGYTLSNLTQGNMADANGAMGNVQNGNGPGSLMGLPISARRDRRYY